MQGEIVAEKLAFPEGPVWHDGLLYFVEIASGAVARLRPGHGVERFALPGGGPNGATLGPDHTLYVTQNGGMTRDNRRTPSVQQLSLDADIHAAHHGLVSELTREVAGLSLGAPNDLAFGPDGRLYFTDPRGYPDPARNKQPGRIFAWDLARSCGELVIELGAVFPNGVAFDREGALYWSETFSRRVMALRDDKLELIVELPERHFPDGFCIDQDGRLYVASTYGHCVSVIEDGRVIERLMCGDGMPTNCCFAGTDLYVTESRHGTLWRFAIGKAGLPLHTGQS
jgi:gluconolactonase